MAAPRLSRRSLLAAAAASAAGRFARPTSALGAPTLSQWPEPELFERAIGTLPARHGLTVELTRVADLVGVEWEAPARAHIELRFADGSGRWSAWVDAGVHGHGPDGRSAGGLAAPGALLGDPVWTGGTRSVQLRASRALTGVRLRLIDVSGGRDARGLALSANGSASGALARLAAAASLPLAAPVLDSGPGQPPIIARRAWALRSSPPRVAPGYGSVRMAFVHHSDNPNGYSPGEVAPMLRAIYVFHRYVNGWNDIGYNFAIDAYGRIFEARAGGIDEPVIGAHAGGYNYASTGVVVLGTYSEVPISTAAYEALERLLAWKLALHGVTAQGRVGVRVDPAGAFYSRFRANALVSLAHIAGHRDADTTDCPGDALYAELPRTRVRVRALAPQPVRATLSLTGQPPSPAGPGTGFPAGEPVVSSTSPAAAQPPAGGAPPPPAGSPEAAPAATAATLMGALSLRDGTPIAGARVAIQARTVRRRGEVVLEQTLAESVTDGEGNWTLPVSLSPSRHARLALRALYAGAAAPGAATPGGGAAVSAPLTIEAESLSAGAS